MERTTSFDFEVEDGDDDDDDSFDSHDYREDATPFSMTMTRSTAMKTKTAWLL